MFASVTMLIAVLVTTICLCNPTTHVEPIPSPPDTGFQIPLEECYCCVENLNEDDPFLDELDEDSD